MFKIKFSAMVFSFVVSSFLIVGCVEQEQEEQVDWTQSPTFPHEELQLYGTDGVFGMIRANGNAEEPDFPVGQGRLYDVYFLDTAQEKHANDGKNYKITAIHQDTHEIVELYEWAIWNNKSGAKFGFDKAGLWEITVTINDVPITKFVVQAEEFTPKIPNIDREYDFTYLEDLPDDKLEKYHVFLNNGDTNSLRDFTPEEMVLIYENLVLEHDTDKLYALTYDGGQLPPFEQFNNEYNQYLSAYFMEDYLKYRYYDLIAIDQQASTEDVKIVRLDIKFRNNTFGRTSALKQENEIWKLDVYHLVKELKMK